MRRGEAVALAQQNCSQCLGLGTCKARKRDEWRACNCVWRAVFRTCYARFRRYASHEGYMAAANVTRDPGQAKNKPRGTHPLAADFCADFTLIAKRTLREDTLGSQVFRFHFLLGADWRICAKRLGMDRGAFFHEVYRVQQKLGRAYSETEPYALFPCDEYMTAGYRRVTGSTFIDVLNVGTGRRAGRPVRAPLRAAAA